jgi:glycosyltransferase involved in cell wall biosynthesis
MAPLADGTRLQAPCYNLSHMRLAVLAEPMLVVKRNLPMLQETIPQTAPAPVTTMESDARTIYSLVVPVYNEVGSLPTLYERISASMDRIGSPYEMIFVDDGSTDGSSAVMRKLHECDPRVRVIQFRRNFGKSPALLAGFQMARGDIIFTMDADLQDDPDEIPLFIDQIEAGYDLVSGWKHPRLDPPSKTVPSYFFNRMVGLTTGVKLHDMNCGFKAYRRELIEELKLYGELHRFIPVMAAQRGFRVTEVPVRHHPRTYGKSKFGARRFLRGFLDLLTVLFLTTYIRTPLRLFGPLGFATFFAGFAIDLWVVLNRLVNNDPIHNHPILYLGIVLMIIGVQFVLTGLQSEMIRHFNFSPREEYSVRQVLE